MGEDINLEAQIQERNLDDEGQKNLVDDGETKVVANEGSNVNQNRDRTYFSGSSLQNDRVSYSSSDGRRTIMEDVDLESIRQPIESQEATHTVKKVVKAKKKYRFDLAVQRNTVWKPEQKSLFVHSLLEGYPIPATFALDTSDGQFWMLDGKQRFTTIIDFVEGNFELVKDTPLVFDTIDIGNRYFDELPNSFKEAIMDAKLKIVMLKNITDDQIAEMFYRLNNGSPLKPIELTRALLGSTMNTIKEISNMKLFNDLVALSPNAKNRFADEEVIMQSAAVLTKEESGLSTSEIRDFMLETSSTIIDEKMTLIKLLAVYLEKAFSSVDEKSRKKILKKINIPMLFVMAAKANTHNTDADTNKIITPEQFGEWAKMFLVDTYSSGGNYASRSSAGSAKKENVVARIKIMSDSFKNTFSI